jgi:uncharacterized protein in vnfD 5'region
MQNMTEVEKELALCEYLEKWARNYYARWEEVYESIFRNRKNEIYRLEGGTRLMDLLYNIMGNIENFIPNDESHLIPQRFASVSDLIDSLKRFKNIVCQYKPIILKNFSNDILGDYIVNDLYKMVENIEKVTDRCERIYCHGEMPKAYELLRESLFTKNINEFKDQVNSVLKNIPYLSRKTKFSEGHFQSMLQILLMVLGFKPGTEKTLSDGRIDMDIELDKLTYVFEFKYTEGGESEASRALEQIKDKGYAEGYRLTSNEIIAVGVSFSGETKNINGIKYETLKKGKV